MESLSHLRLLNGISPQKEDKELEKIKELEERYAQWKTEEQQRQMVRNVNHCGSLLFLPHSVHRIRFLKNVVCCVGSVEIQIEI